MTKLAALAGIVALGMGCQTMAHAYSVNANVAFTFGGSSGGTSPYLSLSNDDEADVSWAGNAFNSIIAFNNDTYLTTLSGYNTRNYYNPDFASPFLCSPGAGIVPSTGVPVTTRKYGCRYVDINGDNVFAASYIFDQFPHAQASGSIQVTDTTMTGVLTMVSTTDEPTGGTAASVGNGTNGYNYRTADGPQSLAGNAWYGITTAGTLALQLTGTFTATSWDINGGAATFRDTGFLCQQGGFTSPTNLLCTASTIAGGYQTNGGHLSWGMDPDGSATTFTTASPITVGGMGTLSGVLASLSVDGSGNITTNSGEFRRAAGSAPGGCASSITFNGSKIACGTLTAGLLSVSGTAASAVPIPAAAWLFPSALGLMGWLRRKQSAA